MSNLFKINLDDLQFEDVVQFTGIQGVEETRPKEGVRIDYKEKVPDDIGDIVTAFSNTYGGLILIGVKADKIKQNIPVDIPGVKGMPDYKSNITNKILSTVYPRSIFSIGVVSHDIKIDHVVIVIRVAESRTTPHMFVANQKNKISIRIEDENRYASLQQIEYLFEKKEKFIINNTSQNRLADLYILESNSRSFNYHRTSLVPITQIDFILDKKMEDDFRKRVKSAFNICGYGDISNESRKATYYQVEAQKNNEGLDYHKAWRLYTSGAIEFISQVGKNHGEYRNEIIGSLFNNTLNTFTIYKDFIEELGYFGDTYFYNEISVVKKTLFFSENASGDALEGIKLNKDSVDSDSYSKVHKTTNLVDYEDIKNPCDIISKSFLEHLRTIFQARVDYTKLLEIIPICRNWNI